MTDEDMISSGSAIHRGTASDTLPYLFDDSTTDARVNTVPCNHISSIESLQNGTTLFTANAAYGSVTLDREKLVPERTALLEKASVAVPMLAEIQPDPYPFLYTVIELSDPRHSSAELVVRASPIVDSSTVTTNQRHLGAISGSGQLVLKSNHIN